MHDASINHILIKIMQYKIDKFRQSDIESKIFNKVKNKKILVKIVTSYLNIIYTISIIVVHAHNIFNVSRNLNAEVSVNCFLKLVHKTLVCKALKLLPVSCQDLKF